MPRKAATEIAVAEPKALAFLQTARQAIDNAVRVDDLKGIRDESEAIKALLKSRGYSIPTRNLAAEMTIRAERRLGEFLKGLDKKSGARTKRGSTMEPRIELADIGIDKKQSHRWQRTHEVPEEEFESYLEWANENEEEVTTAAVLRLRPKKPSNKTRAWSLANSLASVTAAVRKIAEKWPDDQIKLLSAKLRDIADDLDEHGAI